MRGRERGCGGARARGTDPGRGATCGARPCQRGGSRGIPRTAASDLARLGSALPARGGTSLPAACAPCPPRVPLVWSRWVCEWVRLQLRPMGSDLGRLASYPCGAASSCHTESAGGRSRMRVLCVCESWWAVTLSGCVATVLLCGTGCEFCLAFGCGWGGCAPHSVT